MWLGLFIGLILGANISLFLYAIILSGKKSDEEKRILKKLGITIKNKKHTECEIECLMLELLLYYDDPEEYLSKEEKRYQKSLEGTGVSREEYNKLLNKITKIKGEV